MSSTESFIRKTDEGVLIRILVQPRSSRNMVSGVHGDALKIKITSPPVEGAANKACIDYLAKLLKTPKSSLSIVSGQNSRNKSILCRAPENGDTMKHSKTIESRLRNLLA